ncbi:MAG: hypothetical protein Q9219_000382 [cf. Caloplaca sp. 3 TL-2023]
MEDQDTKKSCSFDGLPQELKIHVFSYVGPLPQYWKRARLVCHDWADTIKPFLFEELIFTPCTLSRLHDAEVLEVVRHHVRHLVFFVGVLPRYRFEDWKARAQKLEHINIPQQWPTHKLTTQYELYTKLLEQQRKPVEEMEVYGLGNAGIVPATYITALRSFRRVAEATVRRVHSPDKFGGWYRTAWHQCWDNLRSLQLQSNDLHTCCLIHIILTSLTSLEPGISCLKAGNIDMCYFKHLAHGPWQSHIVSIRNVITMELKIEYASSNAVDDLEGQAAARSVNTFISAAEGLQKLHLSILNSWSDPTGDTNDFLDVFAYISLSMTTLRSLTLSFSNITGNSLRAILNKLRETLKDVSLIAMVIDDSSEASWRNGWPGIFNLMATTMRLESVQLESLEELRSAHLLTMFEIIPNFPAQENMRIQEHMIIQGILQRSNIESACEKLWEIWLTA